MRIAATLILLSAIGASLAVADEPAAPAAPASAASAPALAESTPEDAAKAEAEAKKAAAAEKIKKYGLGGYKPEVHGGNTVYCRTEQQLGSRFTQKQCRSYEQLLADEHAAQDFAKSLQVTGVGPRQ